MQHYGPVMMDLKGTELLPEEKVLLANPNVGGVIFFTRNYQSKEQLIHLVQTVREAASRPLLLAVDHEGGRVWRFKDGFTKLPPARYYSQIYNQDPNKGLALAYQAGWVMAAELLECGIDLSLAPVLDLDRGISEVIGDRAFHQDPQQVVILARAFIEGMAAVGMKATGKHFPGHGGCAPDSHVARPIDDRELTALIKEDMIPFTKLQHQLGAVMPAHIIFPKVDPNPVGFSKRWLQEILRNQLGFEGAVISDCLSMEGAAIGGDFLTRTQKAIDAGCDMVILCQQEREIMMWVLDHLNVKSSDKSHLRLAALQGNYHEEDKRPLLAFGEKSLYTS